MISSFMATRLSERFQALRRKQMVKRSRKRMAKRKKRKKPNLQNRSSISTIYKA
jgi:hypothetical protein